MRMIPKILAVIGVLMIGMLMASSICAFEKGENRIKNTDFEADNVGEPPKEWGLEKGG
jgi:hypothetical protein